jgi:hypothetical protein
MIQISPSIKLFTYQGNIDSGLQIISLVFSHNCNNYHLQGKTTDTIFIFTEGLGIYVLTINRASGYIGLNCFMAPEPDRLDSVFLHTPHEIKEVLGQKWESLAPASIVRKLRNLLN